MSKNISIPTTIHGLCQYCFSGILYWLFWISEVSNVIFPRSSPILLPLFYFLLLHFLANVTMNWSIMIIFSNKQFCFIDTLHRLLV